MPLTTETIEATVVGALEEFGADAGSITREASFEELDVDSLDLAELAQIVEERYGVRIKGEDMEGVRTVGDVVDLIAARA